MTPQDHKILNELIGQFSSAAITLRKSPRPSQTLPGCEIPLGRIIRLYGDHTGTQALVMDILDDLGEKLPQQSRALMRHAISTAHDEGLAHQEKRSLLTALEKKLSLLWGHTLSNDNTMSRREKYMEAFDRACDPTYPVLQSTATDLRKKFSVPVGPV